MVTILPKENDWSDAFQAIGSGVSQGYQNRADDMALQKAIGDLGENPTPRQILDAVTGTKTYNPQAKQNLFKNYLGTAQFEELQKQHKTTREEKQKKEDVEKNNAREILKASDLPKEEKTRLTIDIDEGNINLSGVKELVKPKKKEATDDFTKGLTKERVKQYTDSEKSLVQSQRNLKDLDRLEQLNKQLSGPTGYFNALNPFDQEAAELEALGFGAIEPIVKTFNPSGPIAQKKLEQLSKIYGISRFDSSAKIKGKISALRRYANYAQEIAKKRINLFKEHKGNPPIGDIVQLDLEADALIDRMSQENPTKATLFYSTANGKPVKAPDIETQDKWLREGLITDVKP